MLKKLVITILTWFALLMNFLAISLPLNNRTTQQLSDAYPVYFVPAGYVFSIWGIIYIGLIAVAIYYWFSSRHSSARSQVLDRVFPWHAVGLFANGLWIIFWHYEQVALSVLVMTILLLTLLKTYTLVRNLKSGPEAADNLFRLTVQAPFSIYLGWISVATIANVTVLLYKYVGPDLILGGVVWTAILIFIAGLLGILLIRKYRDFLYSLVIIWSVIGIYVKFPNVTLIGVATFSVVAVLLISNLLQLIIKKEKRDR